MSNDRKTRVLLSAGTVATPLFFAVALGQATTREGFDLRDHMISQLSTGDLGWIQIANFIVTGMLFIAAAQGLKRSLKTGIGRTWLPRLITVFGAGLVTAGVFVMDPTNGYPTNVESADTSWHGVLHGASAVISGFALLAALIILTRRFWKSGEKIAALAAVGSAAIFAVLPSAIPDLMSLLFAIASAISWGFISTLAWKLARSEAAPVSSMPNPQNTTPIAHLA